MPLCWNACEPDGIPDLSCFDELLWCTGRYGSLRLDSQDCQAAQEARGLLRRHILQRRPRRNQGAIHREVLIE
jgi:hypothetical protein